MKIRKSNGGRHGARALIPGLLWLLATGCGGDATWLESAEVPEEEGAVELGTSEAALVNPSSCATAPSFRTINGSGSFTRSAGYSATNCANAYVVDVNDYSRGNDYGTQITYDGPVPTTQADCEGLRLSVGVWERNAARTFIGETVSQGTWVLDPGNQGICRVPRILLEQRFRAYRPDNARDFKLAIRAQNRTAAQQRIALATTSVRQPNVYAADTLRDQIRAQAAGTFHPAVHAVWLSKGTAQGNLLCRSAQLDIAWLTVAARAFTQAGASSTDVNARINSYTEMRNNLCLTGATRTEAAFQTATANFLDAMVKIRDSLLLPYGEQAAVLSYPDHLRFGLMMTGELMEHTLGLLVSNCNTSAADLYNYVNGTLTGVNGDRLLLGSCGNSQTPAQTATSLGVGGNRTAAATQAAVRACMTPESNDICNDPRAQTAQVDGEAPPNKEEEFECTPGPDGTFTCTDLVFSPPPNCLDTENGAVCSEPTKTAVSQESSKAAESKEAIKTRAENAATAEGTSGNRAQVQTQVAQQVDSKPGPIESFIWDLEKFGLGIALAKAAPALGATTTGVFGAALIAIDFEFKQGMFVPDNWDCSFETLNQPFGMCEFIPARPKPDGADPQYCGFDRASGGWFGANPSRYTTGATPQQLTEADRINHCLCQAIDARYANGTGSVFASSMCPNQKEKQAQDCMSNPFGPDDAPRPECLAILQPINTPDEVWRARICSQLTCPQGQEKSRADNDGCSCIAKPAITGSASLGCPVGTLANCSFEDTTACLCTPLDYGDLIFGNNPICRYERNSFPGSLDGWSLKNPDMIAVNRIGNENFVMFETGRISAISAVTPTFYRNSFQNVGTIIRPRTIISRSRTASENIDLQLYCHNPAQNLHHVAMGQCRLNALTPNVASSCDITLNSSVREACLTGSFAFEWTVQAPVSYRGSVGVGPFDFAGTLTATPASQLRPLCPRPAVTPPSFTDPTPDNPLLPYVLPYPLWQASGGTALNPNVLLELGAGGTVPLQPSVGLLRYLEEFAD